MLISLLYLIEKKMARKKIREYDSKRLLKEHFKRFSGRDLPLKSAQVSPSLAPYFVFLKLIHLLLRRLTKDL